MTDLGGLTAHETGTVKRDRSTIAFPYDDLAAAIDVARAVHENGGRAEVETVAAILGQSTTSGAFRVKVSAARMFGLVTSNREGVRLDDLGARILDETTAAEARAVAFLNVALYARLYDDFKARLLPPDSGLEEAIRQLGVAPKQVVHARQVFQRSADQAGYFRVSNQRLVKPPFGGNDDAAPAGAPAETKKTSDIGSPLTDKPAIIVEVFKRLPSDGADFPSAERTAWLRALMANLNLVYGSLPTPSQGPGLDHGASHDEPF